MTLKQTIHDSAVQGMQLRKYAAVISVCVIAICVSVLMAWQLDIEFIKRLSGRYVAMNPMSAIAFICAALSLLFSARHGRIISRSLGLAVLLIGILRILALVAHVDVGIDRLLFTERLGDDISGNIVNSMAPNTALGLMLCGVVLLLPPARGRMANYIALFIFTFGLFSLIGYLYNMREFYGVLHYIPMALNTAICFILFSSALLLSNSNAGFMRTFTSTYSGGRLARLLIPCTIIVPISLGFVRLSTSWHASYNIEFGVTLMITCIIIVFYIMVRYIAVMLDRNDMARTEAEAQLHDLNHALEAKVTERAREIQENEKRFHALIDNTRDIIWAVDKDFRLVYSNRSYNEFIKFITGKYPDPGDATTLQAYGAGNVRMLQESFAAAFNGKSLMVEHTMPFQGDQLFGETQFTPIRDGDSSIEVVTCVTRNVSERMKAQLKVEAQNEQLKEIAWIQSHKVRSQVTTILGLSQFINKDLIHDPELNKVLDGIQAAARELDDVIRVVNDLTRDKDEE